MVVLEIVFLLCFWSWVIVAALFLRQTVLPRVPFLHTPDQLGLAAELASFEASDGVRLEGWKILSDPHQPWIICCHGLGSNRADLLDVAAGLHAAGLNLLLFDFRGHGGSAGRTTSFGWLEQRDLEGALAFLGAQPDIPATPYGVYGISMGASVAVMVAGRDERLGAVAADSPYPGLEEALGRHIGLLYPRLLRLPLLWGVLSAYRLRFGVWPLAVSPQRSAPRSLLIIHGAEDARVPLEGAQAILQGAVGQKELWVIPGAGHLEAYAAQPTAYVARLTRFFKARLT